MKIWGKILRERSIHRNKKVLINMDSETISFGVMFPTINLEWNNRP